MKIIDYKEATEKLNEFIEWSMLQSKRREHTLEVLAIKFRKTLIETYSDNKNRYFLNTFFKGDKFETVITRN